MQHIINYLNLYKAKHGSFEDFPNIYVEYEEDFKNKNDKLFKIRKF